MMLRPLSFIAAAVGLCAIGCSDAPTRPAKIGLTMTIQNPDHPDVTDKECPTGTGVQWDIGRTVKRGGVIYGVQSPTYNCVNNDRACLGTRLENGKSDAEIACTVKKTGSFDATGGGRDPQIDMGGNIYFNMAGTAKKSGTPTTNLINVSVVTGRTGQINSTSDFPSCYVSAVRDLEPGALWADFVCPALTQTGTPSVGCLAFGTVVFEYCKTGEEE